MALCNITYLTSKPDAQICFKLCVDVSWMGFYQDCLNQYGTSISNGIIGKFVSFWSILKRSFSPKNIDQKSFIYHA